MKRYDYEFGVYIGRFQPIHNGHVQTIVHALDIVEKLIIVIGSATTSKSIKNPWTYEERKAMMLDTFKRTNIDVGRLLFLSASDYLYNNNVWTTAVQTMISDVIGESKTALFGHNKDRSTFYLELFPKLFHVDFGEFKECKLKNATLIREAFFEGNIEFIRTSVPQNVYDSLLSEMSTQKYVELVEEYKHIKEYKQLWSSSPYPPTFVTTDAIVVKSGHVLVVKRKMNPGKGLIALPGGFLGQHDSIVDSMVRELKEETRIGLPKDELKKRIVDQRVFDHPDRSLRGRTITHAFCINLGSGELPLVQGDDDADKSWWMSLRDVARHEERFFEDHWHIINFFVSRF